MPRFPGVWHNPAWVRLRPGAGSYTFTAVRGGTTYYRYIVPASTTTTGLRVEAVNTPPFPQTVS